MIVEGSGGDPDLDLLLGDTTLAAALDRAVTVVEPDPAVLPTVVNALPLRGDLVLNPLALTLTTQLTSQYRRLAAELPRWVGTGLVGLTSTTLWGSADVVAGARRATA